MFALRFTPTVRIVTPEWFRRHVLPAYGDTWDSAEADMREDPHEARRPRDLEAELMASGIRRPVSVCFDHRWSARPMVADGMHRAITAMRLGLPVPVGRDHQPPDLRPATDVYRVTTAATPAEDLMSVVMSLATFRLSTGQWIQTDSGAGAGPHAADMYFPHYPELRERIAGELGCAPRASTHVSNSSARNTTDGGGGRTRTPTAVSRDDALATSCNTVLPRLQNNCAGGESENRTPVSCVQSRLSTTELNPHGGRDGSRTRTVPLDKRALYR